MTAPHTTHSSHTSETGRTAHTRRTRATVLVALTALGLGASLGAMPATAATSTATTAAAADTGSARYVYDVANLRTTDPQAAAELKALLAKLPANWRQRQAAQLAKAGIHESPMQAAVVRYLKGETCSPTELDAYVNRLLSGIPMPRLFVLAILGTFSYPTFDALVFGSKDDPRYALTPGTVGKVRGTMAVARDFWDVTSGDIDVLAMRSDMVIDQPRVARLIRFIFGTTPAQANGIAAELIWLIKDTIQLRDGGNPIFSLNAFAFTGEGDVEPFDSISDRIVMGEGMIKALRDTGDIEVGPQMVLSHEFGHHIQFENDAYSGPINAANTRKMELMADAYATYLDAHRRGLNFQAERINAAVEVAHLIGDCAVDDPGHHGTPQQRARAAAWGAALAKKSGNTILPSTKVESLFLAALPGILAG